MQLLTTLFTWLIAAVGCVFYCGHIVMFWNGDGTFFFCAMAPLSFAIFFVTLDRIIALQKPTFLTNRKRKLFVFFQIAVEIGSYLIMVLWEVIPETPPENAITSCMVYGCTSAMAGVKITNMKLYFAILNSIAGLVFTILFVRYNRRRMQTSQPVMQTGKRFNTHNLVAAFTVLMEVTFNCIPNFIGFLAHEMYNVVLSSWVGPYVAYMFAAECLLTVFMYLKVMKIRVFPRSKASSTHPFHSSTHNPNTPVVVISTADKFARSRSGSTF
ncbi:hypothetical protein M3Y95_00403000 [Aphelenchoides besseyi]|nr:hypothetical protein M3Y95_00403000 [Aphelenchoides besseyi]